jgi:hypothetical protein
VVPAWDIPKWSKAINPSEPPLHSGLRPMMVAVVPHIPDQMPQIPPGNPIHRHYKPKT